MLVSKKNVPLLWLKQDIQKKVVLHYLCIEKNILVLIILNFISFCVVKTMINFERRYKKSLSSASK